MKQLTEKTKFMRLCLTIINTYITNVENINVKEKMKHFFIICLQGRYRVAVLKAVMSQGWLTLHLAVK